MSKNSIKTSITLVDELLVDILGSLIPGFLFLITLFFSVFMPLFILSRFSISSLKGKEIPGGFFWVLLIIILILAYVVGHIFFRADIKEPDEVDIKREIKKRIKDVQEMYKGDDSEFRGMIERKLRKTIISLNDACIKVPTFRIWYTNGHCNPPAPSPTREMAADIYWCFCKYCNMAVEILAKNKQGIPKSILLGILFPEEVYRIERERNPTQLFDAKNICGGLQFYDLSEEVRKIWNNDYKNPLSKSKRIGEKPIVNEQLLWMAVCLCILEVQIEIGCISVSESSFPYTYYYKYLLKRNIVNLVDEVKWNSNDSRSKNIINEYKTHMQLFVPEKYAIINKNESHVRMSSSTWHMAKVSIKIASIMDVISFLLIIFIKLKICEILNSQINCFNALLAIAFPASVNVFCIFARFRIVKYIHYQRTREIFHALCAYDQCKDIIQHRKYQQSTSIENQLNV
ncbi:MAG: hypothetical protein IKP36_01055 [Bacteroidaceae bacterium]|nr:hypothetical protein [Bacteroidaceae bacterium]